ncbi:single-stranded DNA-binding protein [Naasia lichenicola]|nr:single-stranded DNA-binding protein [Naasia lichenicola]
MNDSISISGRAGADPTFTTTARGLEVASFSVATDYLRRGADGQLDKQSKQTNWYRVVAFGQLAAGVASAVRKGRTVIVSGRVRIADWENPDGRKGTNVEIIAESVGIDLKWFNGPVTPPAAPARTAPPEQPSTTASDGSSPAEGSSDVASSADAWFNPAVGREAEMADADAPF